MNAQFVIARTGSGRPALMHAIAPDDWTQCGLDIRAWSKSYHHDAIPNFLCKRCAKKVNSWNLKAATPTATNETFALSQA